MSNFITRCGGPPALARPSAGVYRSAQGVGQGHLQMKAPSTSLQDPEVRVCEGVSEVLSGLS